MRATALASVTFMQLWLGVAMASSPSFSPCQIQDLNGIAVYNAECTDITVPEKGA